MDLSALIAQWSGKTPPGFVPPAGPVRETTTMLPASLQTAMRGQGQRGVGRAPVKNVWIAERPVAAEDAPRRPQKAAAADARIANG